MSIAVLQEIHYHASLSPDKFKRNIGEGAPGSESFNLEFLLALLGYFHNLCYVVIMVNLLLIKENGSNSLTSTFILTSSSLKFGNFDL